MRDLKRTIKRLSTGMVHEADKLQPLVIGLEPPCVLGFRAKDCRKTYKLTADACYWLVVKADRRDKERQNRKQRKSKRSRGKK